MEKNDLDKKLEALKKSDKKSRILYALIPIGIIFTVLMVFWNRLERRQDDLNKKANELKLVEDSLRIKEKELALREKDVQYFQSQLAGKEGELLLLSDKLGEKEMLHLDSNSAIYQIVEQKNIANIEVDRIKKQSSFDSKIKINYYAQKSDGNKVIDALSKLGLNLKKDYDTLASRIKRNVGPINSISYGSKVDDNSRQLLALELVKQGFEIRSIEPLKNDKGKENSITIYRNSYILNNAIIKAENIISDNKY